MEEPDAFFPLLDALTDPDVFPGKEEVSHEVQQQRALDTALSVGYLSKPGALEIVRAHLGLHSATPKILAFYRHYLGKNGVKPASNETERCGSWVEWYGGVICEVDELIRVTGPETLDPAKSESSSSLSVCPNSPFLISHRSAGSRDRGLKSSLSIISILHPIVD
jgi:UDP-glucose:glycoprotein glucosyltransferase